MNVINPVVLAEQPPNIGAIREAFPAIVGRKGILFSYGDLIYNPDRVSIIPALYDHETVHCHQQQAAGPAAWWMLYMSDPKFRAKQELEACLAEVRNYMTLEPRPNRLLRARYFERVAERLSSPIYGYMMRRKDAKEAVKRWEQRDYLGEYRVQHAKKTGAT